MRILDRAPATGLSLRMIAREAGVAAPSVYAHFESAESMIETIVRECWRQMGEEISRVGRECKAADPFTVLEAQLNAFVRYAMERPSRYQLLYAMQMSDQTWRDLSGPVQPAHRPLQETLEKLAANGYQLPMPDAQAATILLLSMAHGRIALAHLAPHRIGNSTQGVEAFLRLALKGLFKSATASPPLATDQEIEPAIKRRKRPLIKSLKN